MAKERMNDKPAEVIEKNFLQASSPDMPPSHTVPDAGQIVPMATLPNTQRFTFHNGRDPGHPLEFHYHSKTSPLKHYTLHHGHEYELPIEIIDHLEQCGEAQYGYRPGIDGHPQMYVKGKKYLYRCQPVRNQKVS